MPTPPAPPDQPAPHERERRRIAVTGVVQGVGFRPFVYACAVRHGLAGFVFNHSDGVTIEAEGTPAALVALLHTLHHAPPPLARITDIQAEPIAPTGETGFAIVESQRGAARRTLIAPDTTPCPDCLHELHNPQDRRYHYPFINCTNCGPRFTIVRDIPYDRPFTTMQPFGMCAACQHEYDDPSNRRFHAQPNACPVCGPAVVWHGDAPPTDALRHTAARLLAGDIIAIKGLGGYHLACNALDTAAVARLRERKQRYGKPFALMLPDLATVRRYCTVSPAEADLLTSIQRPIVLLQTAPATADTPPLAASVAPGMATLGVMLPYTPLHVVLLHYYQQATRTQHGDTAPAALVMTSGNLSDEPIAYTDDDARARLYPLADGMLTHNRAISVRCDDSVARVLANRVQMLRRARGYAPQPLALTQAAVQPVLACGAHQKNTFCLLHERQAFISHHIGDLENLETLTAYEHAIAHYCRLFDIAPAVVAHDMHPDYLATGYALRQPLPRVAVQHHHAHIASVMAEHHLDQRVIGIAADGTGYGDDGALWGSEVLLCDLRDYTRAAHLTYVPLPGGEQAVREPWRMAAVYLQQAYGDDWHTLAIPFMQAVDMARWRTLAQMIARGINSPPTSSMGRLFDAVAALLGIRQTVLYEGQAAIELEQLATPDGRDYPFALTTTTTGATRIDLRPMWQALVADVQAGVPPAAISGAFHTTLAVLLTRVCRDLAQQHAIWTVALSGGVFQNRLLLHLLRERLTAADFAVYTNMQVPPNDGGIALGQAAIAAART